MTPERATPGETSNVLVVEDNPVVRLVLRKVLEAEHEVTTAESPQQALELAAGGLATDVDGHVLDPEGRVIPGLYAAGRSTSAYWSGIDRQPSS